MRTAFKILIVSIIVSITTLVAGQLYLVQSQNSERQSCIQWEKAILDERGSVSSSQLSFDAGDFDAACGPLMGPGNQLVISGN
jgi:hypothetical protein